MPIFQVDIEKALLVSGNPTEYWTNVYHVTAATQAAATALGDAIVLLEKAIHRANVRITRFRVQQTSPLSHSGSIKIVNVLGVNGFAGSVLPLFNVVRVDLQPALGRPSRKYLRLPVYGADFNDTGFTTSFLSTINTGYTNPLLATAGLCDPQGETFVAASTSPQMGMRQLRRGSRRRSTPVL